jgi:coenzyme F420-reducing hydrogenase alpha subunit
LKATSPPRYRFVDAGTILVVEIVSPTVRSSRKIEQDLREPVETHPTPEEKVPTWQCEPSVHNREPCISCATHVLHPRIGRAWALTPASSASAGPTAAAGRPG